MKIQFKLIKVLAFILLAHLDLLWGQMVPINYNDFANQFRNGFESCKYVESNYHNSARDSNTTLIRRWAKGPCYAVDISEDIACFGNGGYLEIVNISDPSNP